jgi:hypothetical protein
MRRSSEVGKAPGVPAAALLPHPIVLSAQCENSGVFESMKAWVCLPLLAVLLAGCAGKTAYRDTCASELDAAWRELDLAKAEGFAGTVSYSKALSLLTGAKTQQQFEAFEGCTTKAQKARFYIRESRAGR